MTEPDADTAPAVQPKTRPVPKYEFITILIAVVGIGVTLGGLLLNAAGRIEAQIATTNARLDSAIARADADRRAFQASMDEYRRDMQRLGERQARLEGQRESAAQQ